MTAEIFSHQELKNVLNCYNKFQATASNLIKNSKLFLWFAKNAFDISFVNENIKSVSENIHENKSRKKITKKRKKKSKTDKKSVENADFSAEQKHMTKKTMSSFKNHLDDSKSRSWIFKKQQCHACNDFHVYKKLDWSWNQNESSHFIKILFCLSSDSDLTWDQKLSSHEKIFDFISQEKVSVLILFCFISWFLNFISQEKASVLILSHLISWKIDLISQKCDFISVSSHLIS